MPLVLRVVLGGLFVWHGIDKFDVGIDMIEEMFTMWGVPAPGVSAMLTAIIEIAAGAMLVFGVATRVAAMLLSVVMIGAIVYVKQDLGIISSQPMPGAELDLAMLAGLIALVILGPGPYSVDDKIGFEPSERSERCRHDAEAGPRRSLIQSFVLRCPGRSVGAPSRPGKVTWCRTVSDGVERPGRASDDPVSQGGVGPTSAAARRHAR